ncbi:alpha/beta-hydrolase [Ascodesmis nigricans]|uniref:Alpha/beta-hydrolase n=1 Tax=Ascodesmis nigricans TaxID=341454 RepID=A0A4S2N7B1_9PEZI|nr:alpha/beta-hydrolase [Ascodesmis nigricans]
MTLDEIRAHPGTVRAVIPENPTAAGKATVARNRTGGPINLAYEIHGSGPIRVVWIMGLNGPKIAWNRQVRRFGHEKEEFSSLIFDNRGVGDSDTPWARFTTSEMAKDVLELMDAVGWTSDTKVHVVGVSLGGMIAQELAYHAPNRLQSLTLQSTASILQITLPWYHHFLNRLIMIVPKPLHIRLERVKSNLFSPQYLNSRDPSGIFPTNGDRFVAEELWRMANIKQPGFKGFILQAWAASWHNMQPERLRKVGGAVEDILVCVGDRDKMIEPIHAKILVEGLDRHREGMGWEKVKTRVFEGFGHALQIEVVEEYNDMLEGFWKGVEGKKQSMARL